MPIFEKWTGGYVMEKKGITGSTLKLVAIATMLIDHIGAVILERMLVSNGMLELDGAAASEAMKFMFNNAFLMMLYFGMRLIGRIAFPIFCFLLVEGFVHTHSRKNYALRLLGFALISEIPFDLATRGNILNFEYQNVFFTLLIGFVAMCALDMVKKKYENGDKRTLYGFYTVIAIVACAAAYFLKTDYAAFGVFAIIIMYYFKENKMKSMLYGTIVLVVQSFLEAFSLINLLLVHYYNGERGLKLKYVFYLFYPVHMLVLYAIAYLMGIVV